MTNLVIFVLSHDELISVIMRRPDSTCIVLYTNTNKCMAGMCTVVERCC